MSRLITQANTLLAREQVFLVSYTIWQADTVDPMKCSVWKSSRKEFAYIYLAHGNEFGDLPPELRAAFGEPEFVMDLELTPQRRLAYEDATEVMNNLADAGYHLQMPPTDDPTGLLELTGKKETSL